MDFYEKMPADLLTAFFEEKKKDIEKGMLSKNMYYELGLMISSASKRGITLGKPSDFDQVVDQQVLADFIESARNYKGNGDYPLSSCGV